MRALVALALLVSLPAFAASKAPKAAPKQAAKISPTDRLVAYSTKKLSTMKGVKIGYMSGISEDEEQTMQGVGVTVRSLRDVNKAYGLLTGKSTKSIGKVGSITTALHGVDLVIGTKATFNGDGE